MCKLLLHCLITIIYWTLINSSTQFDCPNNLKCDVCVSDPRGFYTCEIDVNNSTLSINFDDEFITIECWDSMTWSDFDYINRTNVLFDDIERINFRYCPKPDANKLSLVTKKFINIDKVEQLNFYSYLKRSNYTLDKINLQSFNNIKRLIYGDKALSKISDDLLEGFSNLHVLHLGQSNLQELPKNVFNNILNISAIDFSNNKLISIDSNIFSKLTQLKLLNLWNNNLKEIEPNTFDNLISLETLDLRGNELKSLPNDVFNSLRNLSYLCLSQNYFNANSINENLIKNNKKLLNFRLSENQIPLITLPNNFFNNLTSLNIIELQSNGLKYLPDNLLYGANNISELYLQNNNLSTIDITFFRDCYTLLKLKLNSNQFKSGSLPDKLFKPLKRLKLLDLSDNQLTIISRYFLNGLESLEVLNLERNQLLTINSNAFMSLTKLLTAHLSWNQLDLNDSLSPFRFLRNLKELYLSHNNISFIFHDFHSMLELQKLDLSYNKIRQLSNGDTDFLTQIYIDLSHNEITKIELGGIDEYATNNNNFGSITINLDYNPIDCNCDIYHLVRYYETDNTSPVKNVFKLKVNNLNCSTNGLEQISSIPITNIKSQNFVCKDSYTDNKCPSDCECWEKPHGKIFMINCSSRYLKEPPKELYSPPEHVIELNLSNNFLNAIPSINLPGYNNVVNLLLSNNTISNVNTNGLVGYTDLQMIDLRHNNINRINATSLSLWTNSTKQLRSIYLNDNQFICDCSLRDFVHFVQNNQLKFPELKLITCTSTKNVQVHLYKLISSKLCPTKLITLTTIFSILIGIIGIIFGILIAIYYRYHHEIKVWLYAHRIFLWFVTEQEIDKDKLYDAFISFSHKDEDFVVNNLIKNLEEEPDPFKLCVHFRDWLAGDWIPDQITRSVENSRRTIVVLSMNFLESIWGKMEFRVAHKQALIDGAARVIIILYGDIELKDITDPELKAYLNMNTYLKWGDPWFWNKLKYALPHRNKLTKDCRKNTFFKKQIINPFSNDDLKKIINENLNNDKLPNINNTNSINI